MSVIFLTVAVSLIGAVILGVSCILFMGFADTVEEARRWLLRTVGMLVVIYLLICMIGAL